MIKTIKPRHIFSETSNLVFDIGNTGRIVAHEVLERNEFRNVFSFYTKHRGIIIFDGKSTVSRCGLFYSDPREVLRNNNKFIFEDIKNCEEKIKYYSAKLVEQKQRINSQSEKDEEVFENFYKQITYKNEAC